MPGNPPNSSASAANQQANNSFSSGPAGSTIQGCPCQGSEHATICMAICSCETQWCVSKKLWALDAACNFKSTIKAEVPYDMSTSPPQPYMSKTNPQRATRRRPADSRIPDVVITKDGSKPPTQDNIAEVVEIKYPGDSWKPGQERAYQRIAGTAPLTQMGPEECGCGSKQPAPVPVPVPVPAPQPEKKGLSGWQIAGLAIVGVAVVAAVLLAPEVTLPALGAAAEEGGPEAAGSLLQAAF